jgi:hypothetical protein
MPQVWRGSGSIGVSLYAFLYCEVKKLSDRPIRVILIAYNNDTRPTADPRPAFAWKGLAGSATGDNVSDGLISVGHVCSYGDVVAKMPPDFVLTTDEQIGFRFNGENGDSVNAKVIYEVKRDG